MQTIEIDDRVFQFLLRNTNRFGESPSEVLERLLKVPFSGNGQSDKPQVTGASSPGQTRANTVSKDPIAAFLSSPAFLVQGNAINRFLSTLSWLQSQNSDKFEKVLLLNGRKRRYFARTAEELEASGNSVMPKRIPNTPYWVVSNSPTQLKKQIIADVMRVLGYDPSSVRTVVEAIR
jgi:negative modulator of initiation of replication